MIAFELIYIFYDTIIDWINRDRAYCKAYKKTFGTMFRSNWKLYCDIKESCKR